MSRPIKRNGYSRQNCEPLVGFWGKIASSRQKRSGSANGIDKAYAAMNITKKDVPRLVAFLKLLDDVSDKDFRNLILKAKLLDTSKDIE